MSNYKVIDADGHISDELRRYLKPVQQTRRPADRVRTLG